MTGDNIKALREKSGITQKQFASMLGISPSAVGMYEQNRRTPDAETLRLIASKLGVTVDALVSGSKPLDIMIEEMRGSLLLSDGIMFNGELLSEDDIDAVIEAMKIGARVALAAKRKQ